MYSDTLRILLDRLEAFDLCMNEYAKMATEQYEPAIDAYRHETIAPPSKVFTKANEPAGGNDL